MHFYLDFQTSAKKVNRAKTTHTHKNNNKLAQHNVDISNWNWYSATCMHTQKRVKCNLNSLPDMLAHPRQCIPLVSFSHFETFSLPHTRSDAIAVDSIYFFCLSLFLFLVEMRFVVFSDRKQHFCVLESNC
jgi:hypothetical protein